MTIMGIDYARLSLKTQSIDLGVDFFVVERNLNFLSLRMVL